MKEGEEDDAHHYSIPNIYYMSSSRLLHYHAYLWLSHCLPILPSTCNAAPPLRTPLPRHWDAHRYHTRVAANVPPLFCPAPPLPCSFHSLPFHLGLLLTIADDCWRVPTHNKTRSRQRRALRTRAARPYRFGRRHRRTCADAMRVISVLDVVLIAG